MRLRLSAAPSLSLNLNLNLLLRVSPSSSMWPGIWSNLDLLDFIPSLNALDGFTNALAEAVGTTTYWMTGKL